MYKYVNPIICISAGARRLARFMIFTSAAVAVTLQTWRYPLPQSSGSVVFVMRSAYAPTCIMSLLIRESSLGCSSFCYNLMRFFLLV